MIWYCFTTPPQAEVKARAWFDFRGIECWFPTETRWKNQPRAKIKRVAYEARLVPGYIFAAFGDVPAWHTIKASRYISGVVGRGIVPAAITGGDMAKMLQVPQRLASMREAEQERLIVRPGDQVTIVDGTFTGWVVDVTRVHGGIARFISPLLGGREIEVDLAKVSKVG